MFRAILYQQWKWTRLIVCLGTVAAFAIPIFSLSSSTAAMDHKMAAAFLGHVQGWGVFYPVLAGTLGVLVAIALWTPDHRGRHVYSLALPIPRWRYVALRYLAGLTLLAAPVAALAAGALIASATASFPVGLHPYPVGLAIRFTLALLVAFTLFFAVSSGTARTAATILGSVAALVVIQVLMSAAGSQLNILMPIANALLTAPGPFAIFTGRWMLIDV
ncbi:MAG TPA: hypothetical protein VFD85_09560 [Gemmatimonadales bacterium]|nr:hypothetical protein [Gemmatimonadales bacterium]